MELAALSLRSSASRSLTCCSPRWDWSRMTFMWQETLVALRVTLVTLLLTCILYPISMTGLAQALFPHRANGSLTASEDGRIVGSELIAQRFNNPAYFQPRPSAAGDGYDATASSGSNLGPTSQKLRDRISTDLAQLTAGNPGVPSAVPVELVTTSASGLDPHVSPAGALWQGPPGSRGRPPAPESLRAGGGEDVEGRDLGVLGEPRINVLLLNLALDRQFGRPS